MLTSDRSRRALSLAGIVGGVALLVGAATVTTSRPASLHTAAFVGNPVPARRPVAAATTATAAAPPVTSVPPSSAPPSSAPPSSAPASSAPPSSAPPSSEPSAVERVVAFALAQRGHPYRKGAAGPDAFDCSGLTRAAFAAAGIDLPHYSVTQAAMGRAVDWHRAPIERGDLVFTRGDSPVIDLGHVGLALSPSEWVVASGPGIPVRVAPIPSGAVQRVRRLLD